MSPIKNLKSNQSNIFEPLLIAIIVSIILKTPLYESQVVSHELRRLAVASNQFGIDTLKALDKIEPPDRVLVFCPICISSSLSMIMMGSSKYHVVNSLRHALYVWSMKPHEINKGFKDLFEHIGLNQLQHSPKFQTIYQSNSSVSRRVDTESDASVYGDERARSSASEPEPPSDAVEYEFVPRGHYFSLPKLIKMKEFLDRSGEDSYNHALATMNQLDTGPSNRIRRPTVLTKHNALRQATDNSLLDYRKRFGERGIGDMSQMSAISNIYMQRGLILNYNYNILLRQSYKTVIHPVDFTRHGEETRQHINSLVAASTEGKIKDLVKRGSFDVNPRPRIMIISTFHFRGTLDIQMKSKNSVTKTPARSRSGRQSDIKTSFHPANNSVEFIETEETLLKYGQFKNLDCTVIEIPFNNRLVSLLIVMPNHKNSTELVIAKLNAKVLNDMVDSLTVKKISVEIPVIKFDRGPINIAGLLRELGLSDIFGDKNIISETGPNKWMRPEDIVHETSIDIGTINPKWAQTEDRLKVGAHESRNLNVENRKKALATSGEDSNRVKLDKTFFYFVLDSINGLVLTMGRIRQ